MGEIKSFEQLGIWHGRVPRPKENGDVPKELYSIETVAGQLDSCTAQKALALCPSCEARFDLALSG